MDINGSFPVTQREFERERTENRSKQAEIVKEIKAVQIILSQLKRDTERRHAENQGRRRGVSATVAALISVVALATAITGTILPRVL